MIRHDCTYCRWTGHACDCITIAGRLCCPMCHAPAAPSGQQRAGAVKG